MIHLPWVSRALYEASLRRCADLETERRLLLNRLAEKAGFRTIFPEESSQQTADSVQPPAHRDKAAMNGAQPDKAAEPETTKATIDGVEAWANNFLRKRALDEGKLRFN